MTGMLVSGFGTTLQIFLLTLVGSIPLAIPVALARMSRIRLLSWAARAYISVLRGTPLMLQMFFAEIYRSGIQSIPRGQYEAAEVLGYSRSQTFWRIVAPQVAKRIIPAMGNEIITLVKDTSLAFSIGVAEMFSTAKALVASQVSMVPFAIAAAFYWVFNFLVELALGAVEKKMDYYHD